MTNQPKWKCVDQLGDRSPLDYGGYWVFVDTTGVYEAEGEWVEVDEATNRLTIYRFILEKCTFVDGILSDNKFHPEHPAWFAKDLSSVAASSGTPVEELRTMLCSDDPIQRALAYREIGNHWGFRNLDDYPLEMGRTEGRRRYKKVKYRTPA
jgi:hypothetical protein